MLAPGDWAGCLGIQTTTSVATPVSWQARAGDGVVAAASTCLWTGTGADEKGHSVWIWSCSRDWNWIWNYSGCWNWSSADLMNYNDCSTLSCISAITCLGLSCQSRYIHRSSRRKFFFSQSGIISLNAHSLTNKSRVTHDHILDKSLDLMCLVETWHQSNELSILILSCSPESNYLQKACSTACGGLSSTTENWL